MWRVDLDPTRGREQSKDRPVLVVSSLFRLNLTMGDLVTVLPMTSVLRPGWLHHVRGEQSWVLTEQVRTVSAERFSQPADVTVSADDLAEVRRALAQMLAL